MKTSLWNAGPCTVNIHQWEKIAISREPERMQVLAGLGRSQKLNQGVMTKLQPQILPESPASRGQGRGGWGEGGKSEGGQPGKPLPPTLDKAGPGDRHWALSTLASTCHGGSRSHLSGWQLPHRDVGQDWAVSRLSSCDRTPDNNSLKEEGLDLVTV